MATIDTIVSLVIRLKALVYFRMIGGFLPDEMAENYSAFWFCTWLYQGRIASASFARGAATYCAAALLRKSLEVLRCYSDTRTMLVPIDGIAHIPFAKPAGRCCFMGWWCCHEYIIF